MFWLIGCGGNPPSTHANTDGDIGLKDAHSEDIGTHPDADQGQDLPITDNTHIPDDIYMAEDVCSLEDVLIPEETYEVHDNDVCEEETIHYDTSGDGSAVDTIDAYGPDYGVDLYGPKDGFVSNDTCEADTYIFDAVDYIPGDLHEEGMPTCIKTSETDQTCDLVDDDCDGETDEDFTHQIQCGVGECMRTGIATCVGGKVVEECAPGTPSPEICDKKDNNCDGETDEICIPSPSTKDIYLIGYTSDGAVMPKTDLISLLTSANPQQTSLSVAIGYCGGDTCSLPEEILAQGIRLCNMTGVVEDGCNGPDKPDAPFGASDLLTFSKWLPPGNSVWRLMEGDIPRGELGTSINAMGYSAGLLTYTDAGCNYFHSTFVCK
jgi:hypothetical protein